MKRKKLKSKKEKIDRNTAIAVLIANLVIPGIGTLIAKKTNQGILQLVLYLVGVLMILSIAGIIIGFPLALIVWVWALATSIKTLQESR